MLTVHYMDTDHVDIVYVFLLICYWFSASPEGTGTVIVEPHTGRVIQL